MLSLDSIQATLFPVLVLSLVIHTAGESTSTLESLSLQATFNTTHHMIKYIIVSGRGLLLFMTLAYI